MKYQCERLGYDTQPAYQFNCWTPRKHVVALMNKEMGGIFMKNIQSVHWLYENIERENVRIIDCRFSLSDPEAGRKAYERNHIKGALYFDLEKDLSGEVKKHGGRHPLPSIDILTKKLEKAGIDENTVVIAYDHGEEAFATRFWWLLTYLGHEHVYILDGGYKEWLENEYPISSEIPTYDTTVFPLHIKAEMLATYQDVKNITNNKESVLIDSRARNRYIGYEEPIDRKPGHIPTAINKEWTDCFHDGKWKTAKEQAKRFSDIHKNTPLVVYCGSGVTATSNVLALQEAGYKNVKLYVGSYSDWVSYDDNEVETGQGNDRKRQDNK